MSKNKKEIVSTALYSRFVHVVMPKADSRITQVQAVSEQGKLLTVKCNQAIFELVRGEMIPPARPGDPTKINLGLRQLVRVKFRAHFDADEVIQALDILPNRMFTSGAAPRAAGKASKSGFEVHWDEALQGFDVWTEDQETGDKARIAYAGMSEKALIEVLDALRDFKWGTRKTVTLEGHKIEKVDETTLRIRPAVAVTYVT